MLTLSIIIPVYNEERHIEATLQSISNQTLAPTEVIVVDNNSTDSTAEIVKRFTFVTLIKENKQGRAHARNAGFNAARGDIIARIDADSRLHGNWVETLLQVLEDESIDGVTGLGTTPLIPYLRWPRTTLYTRSYYWNVHGIFGTVTMWGATLAIRKHAWLLMKDKVSTDDFLVHEDQDMSLWMAGKGLLITQCNELRIESDNQSFRYFPKLTYYMRLRNRTKKHHQQLGNLPAPIDIRIPLPKRIGSHLLSVPAVLWGLAMGMVTFPLDYLMFRILGHKNWFD